MGGQEAPFSRCDSGQRRQLAGRRETGRRVDQTRRQAQRPLVHPPLQRPDHGLQLCRGGGPIRPAHGRPAQGVVADQQAEVDRDAGIQEAPEVLPHLVPAVVQAVHFADDPGPVLPPGPPDGGGRVPAVSPDLAGHPLEDGALGRGGQEQVVIGVAVDVHKARAGRQPLRLDDPAGGRPFGLLAHGQNAIPVDGDVAGQRGSPAAVEDGGPANQDIQLAGVAHGLWVALNTTGNEHRATGRWSERPVLGCRLPVFSAEGGF